MSDIEKELVWNLITLIALLITGYDYYVAAPERRRKYWEKRDKEYRAAIYKKMRDPEWQESMRRAFEAGKRP